MNIKHLDWIEYHNYIDKLSHIINKQYKYIAGLDDDDMIVAVHLTHTLRNCSIITDIGLMSMLLNYTDNYEDLLLVSNVVNTGNTFNKIMDHIKYQVDTATLFVDKDSKFKPTFYVEKPNERIYFPWQKCGLNLH